VQWSRLHGSSCTPEELDAVEFDKIYTKLRNIEKESGRTLDWSKVKKVLAEAQGIPVPIFEIHQESEKSLRESSKLSTGKIVWQARNTGAENGGMVCFSS